MNAGLRPSEDLAFRPDAFFRGLTLGDGLIRDSLGRISRRFHVETRGYRDETYGGLSLDESYAFDNGEIDSLRWLITAAGADRYVLAESLAGSGILAHAQGGEFVFGYNRPVGKARGFASPHFAVRMTLLAPGTVLKTVRVTLLGAPLGSMTALHSKNGARVS